MIAAQSKSGQQDSLNQRISFDNTSLAGDVKAGHSRAMSVHLKKWRLLLGFTLAEVGAKVGKHFSAVGKWETGINAVGMKELELLGRAYGVPAILLTLDPGNRERMEFLMRAHSIIFASDPQNAEAWLSFGEKTIKATPPIDGATSKRRGRG